MSLNEKTVLPEDLDALVPQRDEVVRERTGASWTEWVERLDARGCAELSHAEIARIAGEHVESGWWAQTVTVGYERIKGLRDVGQQRDGDFTANKSKTFPVAAETLFEVLSDEQFRASWLGDAASVRGTNPPKSVRLDWNDDSRVTLGVESKANDKSTLSVQHHKLASAADIDARKAFWATKLAELAEHLRNR